MFEMMNYEISIELPLLYTPYYIDSRMSAQGSYFMVWGTRQERLEEILKDERYYMKLPEKDNGVYFYGEEQREAILLRFIIDASMKQTMLRELDLMGINEKTLFPGLDGVGRYIERKFRFNYNEAIDYS